jgi:hypothetical protein
MKKNIEKAKKVNRRIYDMGVMFEHFTTNQWVYETAQIYEFMKQMTVAERLDFFIDPKDIDWPTAAKQYIYGI